MVEEIKWEWDEKKLEKALEEFKEALKENKTILVEKENKTILEELKDRKKKIYEIQNNYLIDANRIDKLSIKELKEIFEKIWVKRRAEKFRKEEFLEQMEKSIKDFLKELIKNGEDYDEKKDWPNLKYLDDKKNELGLKDLGVSTISQLLTMRYPDKFYIVNDPAIKALNKLLDKQISLDIQYINNYPKLQTLFKDLRNHINKIYKEIHTHVPEEYQELFNREANFYDVDLFLWWHSEENNDKGEISIERESSNSATEIKTTTTQPSLLSQYFQNKGYYFDDKLITAFYAALKTKGFVILSGLSGTGKTKLALLFAELLDAPKIFLSVRPDWRDSKALLGYYNPLSQRYEKTQLLDFIIKAIKNYEESKENPMPYFIILDEMNLSHVEYYFADFLSVLESGRGETGFTKESIKLESYEIKLPPNLYIIGTVNVDETTYMFSPKVLDRAFTLEFRDIDLKNYLSKPLRGFSKDQLEQLRNSLLEDLKNKNKDGKARFCGVIADKKEIKEAIIELIADNKEKIKNAINELIPDKEKIESALNKLNELGKLDAVDKEKIEGTINGLDELSKSEVTNKEKIKEAINKLEESINKLKELDQSEVTNKEEIKEALNKLEEFTNKLKELGKLGELKRLNNILQPYDLYFGYRVLDEIALFVKYAMNTPTEVKNLNENEALDFAVLMKVLPKFHGPRQKLEKPLWLVLNWCLEDKSENSKPLSDLKREIWEKLTGKEKEPTVDDIASVIEEMPKDKFKYPRTAKKVLMMLRQLYETGFASFS